MIRITQSIARSHIFQADSRSDVTRTNLFDFITLVSMHLYDTAKALFLLLH
ncbi:Uncharacterised protein [Vibrio cholerae]|nr:Uncharacterised protein [Vibrio cholerae]